MMYMTKMLRYLFNSIISCVIPYYIMTIDEQGEEGGLDLVQNFTALFIMCDIDQLLAYNDEALITKIKEEIERV